MSMVWPCPLGVEAYASMGRAVRVPRPRCPSCLVPVVFWSGYWRHVRWQRGVERKIFIRRVRCRACGVTHALLPAFTLARRLDAADTAGAGLGAGGAGGWVGFSALAAELGGEVVRPVPYPRRSAVAAISAAFTAAAGLPG